MFNGINFGDFFLTFGCAFVLGGIFGVMLGAEMARSDKDEDGKG